MEFTAQSRGLSKTLLVIIILSVVLVYNLEYSRGSGIITTKNLVHERENVIGYVYSSTSPEHTPVVKLRSVDELIKTISKRWDPKIRRKCSDQSEKASYAGEECQYIYPNISFSLIIVVFGRKKGMFVTESGLKLEFTVGPDPTGSDERRILRSLGLGASDIALIYNPWNAPFFLHCESASIDPSDGGLILTRYEEIRGYIRMNSSNPDVPLKCEAGVSNSLMHVSNVFIPNGIMRDYLTREFDIICFLLTHRPAGTYIFVARSPVIAKALGSGEALYEDIAQITLATIREYTKCTNERIDCLPSLGESINVSELIFHYDEMLNDMRGLNVV